LAFLQNFTFFEVEMASDDSLEAFWRILDVLGHGEFDIAISNYISIGLVLLFSFHCALLMLKPWLIEVDVFTHDD
jgi:hypothetical protein